MFNQELSTGSLQTTRNRPIVQGLSRLCNQPTVVFRYCVIPAHADRIPGPLVPQESRRAVVDIIHSLSHLSIHSTVKLKLVKQMFVRNRMAANIKEGIKACPQCQAFKVQRHTKDNMDNIFVATRRFSHIHVDIVGPPPPSNKMCYLFTVIDNSTR